MLKNHYSEADLADLELPHLFMKNHVSTMSINARYH